MSTSRDSAVPPGSSAAAPVTATGQHANPELAAYYADRGLLGRNVALILLLNVGWSASLNVVNPLITLRMNERGFDTAALGMIGSVNSWAVCFLVMYFSWKSDHTVSRFGRRIPFLFISAPMIVLTIALFPFVELPWLLLLLMALQLFFMDMKGSTIPLLSIDCVPRAILARVLALNSIALGVVGFFAMRYGMRAADLQPAVPYLCTAALMVGTTLLAGFLIREPPIRNPATVPFDPGAALRVGWRDRRAIVLMLGVGSVHSFFVMHNTWIWLYAKNDLGLTRAQLGDAFSWAILAGILIAFPAGWVIDRFGSYVVVVVFWLLSLAAFATVMVVSTIPGLIAYTLLIALLPSLYNAADIMVYKTAHPRDVGSVTSSNSFTRNLYIGCLTFISGFLIKHFDNNYKLAFALGMAMSTVGLVLIFVYRFLMRRKAPAA